MTGKEYVTQQRVGTAEGWRYEKPAHGTGPKTQLLTIGGIAVTGQWRGEVGEYFLAWAPLLRRDKDKERQLLDAIRAKKYSASPPKHSGSCLAAGGGPADDYCICGAYEASLSKGAAR